MKDKQKIFIIGNKYRGDEIKDILTGLGAHPVTDVSCNDDRFIYFINHENEISVALVGSEVAKIIMDNYKEIKLPQQPWWYGDILIDDSEPKSYAVFKEYKKYHTFGAYFILINKTAYFDTSASVETFHLASEEELKNLPRLFRLLRDALNVDDLCLPKKVEQNPLTDNEAKRLREEND